LLCSIASWFGQLLDQRARQAWQAGSQQFGFKAEVGCMEAVMVLLSLILSRTSKKERLFVLWVDLRTAFPSLNRAILLQRLFTCGMGLGFCRLLLSIFDMTFSLVCIGRLIGHRFLETLGVREGAVESPHLFNAYIEPLRDRLVEQHPRLCKMCDVIIAVLMYADDAALPADSIEDLIPTARILEEFCNENRLFISVPKSFITVFHHATDVGVVYRDGNVFVDGLWGKVLAAVPEFKYLGVLLNSTATIQSHIAARTSALQHAAGLLSKGLSRTPGGSLEFSRYLWNSLVHPVSSYGMELFVWSDAESKEMRKVYLSGLRQLLSLGGRAPIDCTTVLAGSQCCTITWRIRRVALLLRLLNSPPDSLQHLALATLVLLKSEWVSATMHDLQLVLPGINLRIGGSPYGPIVSSSSRWSDAGEWLSAQPWTLPFNDFGIYGHRCRTPLKYRQRGSERKAVRFHIRRITQQLQIHIRRESNTQIFARVIARNSTDAFAKTLLLAARLQSPGPPLHICLGWIGPPLHRSAVAATFAGDIFLARYSGNFFAKRFIPQSSNHLRDAAQLNIDPTRVCISCWHFRRQLIVEGEGHVFMECPDYDNARQEFLNNIDPATNEHIKRPSSGDEKLLHVICSNVRNDWEQLGRFAARIRQSRRHLRRRFEGMGNRLEHAEHHIRSASWKASGGRVCRHGICFTAAQGTTCPCMQTSSLVSDPAQWKYAKSMPKIAHELKAIIMVPFSGCDRRRIGQLQAEMKRRNYT
jgi:hypothetical protein